MTLPLIPVDDPDTQFNFDKLAAAATQQVPDILNVKSYGAKGNGTTDDTAAIVAAKTALGSNGGTILLPRGSYKFTTLNFDDSHCIRLVGEAGLSGAPSTRLISSTTGSGTLVSAKSTSGFQMADLWLGYDSSSFTGTLLNLAHSALANDSSHGVFERCLFSGSGVRTAGRLVSLDNAIVMAFNQCQFSGAAVGVRGAASSGNYSNVVSFVGCEFGSLTDVGVLNAVQSWSFVNCSFEGLVDSGGTAAGAGAVRQDATYTAVGMDFSGCWFGDATAAGTWITFMGSGLSVRGCTISTGVTGVKLRDTTGTRAVAIHGNQFTSMTNGVDCGSAAAYLDIFANDFQTVTNEVVLGATPASFSRIQTVADGYSASIFGAILMPAAGNPLFTIYERADPGSAAPADAAYIYVRDNGAGKTQVVAKFSSGAVQVIATQP